MKNRFDIFDTEISSLKIIQRKLLQDQRGYFERFFCSEELKTLIAKQHVAQINHTLTKEVGTVRGLHFQTPPYAEKKFVGCLKGKVYDVAVDVRKNSPTFLKYHSEILTDENCKTFFIPEGFAHGFQTLTNDCEMIYLHTHYYNPEAEYGLNPLDPKLNINWPLPVRFCSDRDKSHSMITDDFVGIIL